MIITTLIVSEMEFVKIFRPWQARTNQFIVIILDIAEIFRKIEFSVIFIDGGLLKIQKRFEFFCWITPNCYDISRYELRLSVHSVSDTHSRFFQEKFYLQNFKRFYLRNIDICQNCLVSMLVKYRWFKFIHFHFLCMAFC